VTRLLAFMRLAPTHRLLLLRLLLLRGLHSTA
jgi:hypothetical protein